MLLKGILEQPKGTPYWGLIKETGIWPLIETIIYKKLMLQEIQISQKERIIKQIIEDQKTKEYKGWYNEVKNLAREYKINIEEEFIRKSTKEEWKKEITVKINRKIEEKIEKLTRNKTKLRNIKEDKYEMKQYMKKGTLNECKESLKIRLNMIETTANFIGRYGEDIQCKACGEKEETTEHILECKTYRKMTRRENRENREK